MKAACTYRVRRALGGALLFGSLTAPALAQQSGCESYVAPFFRGTGGFVAKPSEGLSVGVTVRRGSSSRAETLFVHDAQKLMGIIPHLASPAAANSCQERVAPIFRGRGGSAATTVRWYRSSDSGIDASDTEVGTASLAALDASARATASADLDAPSDTGTYSYGACVEAVAGESDTGNNCSSGATVEVGLPGDFDLASENDAAQGITYADGRLYVVDATDEKVYAYDSSGSHLKVYTCGSLRGSPQMRSPDDGEVS